MTICSQNAFEARKYLAMYEVLRSQKRALTLKKFWDGSVVVVESAWKTAVYLAQVEHLELLAAAGAPVEIENFCKSAALSRDVYADLVEEGLVLVRVEKSLRFISVSAAGKSLLSSI